MHALLEKDMLGEASKQRIKYQFQHLALGGVK